MLKAPASTNEEVIRGELGWWSIKARWDIARLMYWHKLCWGRNRLASWVFHKRKKEMNTRDKDNWCRYTKTLLEELGLVEHWDGGYEGTRSAWKQLVVDRIRKRTGEDGYSAKGDCALTAL